MSWNESSKNSSDTPWQSAGVGVDGDVEVARDADAARGRASPDRGHVVDVVLDAEVVRPVARVQEELVRHEDLEEDPTDLHEARVPASVLEPVEHHDTVEELAVVLDGGVVVVVHDVEVLDAPSADRARVQHHAGNLHGRGQ